MSAAASNPVLALPRPASLRINFAWTSAGNAVYAACQWGMVSVLAHWGGAGVVGEYALGLAVTAPVLMLAQLNLRAVLATDTHGEANFADYRGLRLVMLMSAACVIAALAWTGASAPAGIVLLTGAMQAVEWVSDIYLGLLQRREDMGRIAISVALRGALSLGALGLGMAFGGLLTALVAVTAVRLLVFVIYDRGLAFRERPIVVSHPGRARYRLALARTALPLGIVLMIGSVAGNMPRYWIAHYLDPAAVGVFAALASLGMAGNFVVNALGQAATPALAKKYAAGDRRGFLSITSRMTALGAALWIGGIVAAMLLGKPLLKIAYGAAYEPYAGLFIAVMAACGIGYLASLLGYALTAARLFTVQVPLQLATVAAAAAVCGLLIPRLGLMGAPAGLASGSLVQLVAEGWLLRRIWMQGVGARG